MSEPDRDQESFERAWATRTFLGSLEFVLYGALAAVLVLYLTIEAGRATWESPFPIAFGFFGALVAGGLLSLGRDLVHGRIRTATKLLLLAWALCAGLLTILSHVGVLPAA